MSPEDDSVFTSAALLLVSTKQDQAVNPSQSFLTLLISYGLVKLLYSTDGDEFEALV